MGAIRGFFFILSGSQNDGSSYADTCAAVKLLQKKKKRNEFQFTDLLVIEKIYPRDNTIDKFALVLNVSVWFFSRDSWF